MDAMAGVSPYVDGTRILRTLGAGSFGRVVLARYPDTRVDVALKIADRRGGTSRKRILWEAACLREVAHAHVVRLLDVCASTPGGEKDPRDFLRVVEGFRRAEGIAPHPAVAYRMLEAENQTKRAKVSPRASTPRPAKKRKTNAK